MWGKELPTEFFECIMLLTERYPYYVNALCDEVWSEAQTIHTIDNVNTFWEYVIEGERSDLIRDFLNLSDNQRKVLIQLANFGGENIYANCTAKQMDIPVSSLASAIAVLEKDFIEKIGVHYSLVVRVYKWFLQRSQKEL